MTIKECIDIVDNIKPNQYTVKEKVMWLSFVDEIIINEVLKTHEGYDGRYDDFVGYSEEKLSMPLIVPSPYDRLYTEYLKMKIDSENGETARYNNSAALYNSHMMEFRRYYNKTHMPIDAIGKTNVMPPKVNTHALSDAEYEKIKRDVIAVLDETVQRNTSPDRIYDIVMSYIRTNSEMFEGKPGYTPQKNVDYFDGVSPKISLYRDEVNKSVKIKTQNADGSQDDVLLHDGRSPFVMKTMSPLTCGIWADGFMNTVGINHPISGGVASYTFAGNNTAEFFFPLRYSHILGERVNISLNVLSEADEITVGLVYGRYENDEANFKPIGNLINTQSGINDFSINVPNNVPEGYKVEDISIYVNYSFYDPSGETVSVSDVSFSIEGVNNWWIWDDESGKYVDSGINAQGDSQTLETLKSDLEGIRSQIENESHFRGYFLNDRDIINLPATPNDFAYSAESGKKWIYTEVLIEDGVFEYAWQNTNVPVPDQLTPASNTTPLINGVASVGKESAYARGDHRHPTDTTRVSVAEFNYYKQEVLDMFSADNPLFAEAVQACFPDADEMTFPLGNASEVSAE